MGSLEKTGMSGIGDGVGSALRVRAGSVFLVMANQEREAAGLANPVVHDTDGAVRIAVEAVRGLIKKDQKNL